MRSLNSMTSTLAIIAVLAVGVLALRTLAPVADGSDTRATETQSAAAASAPSAAPAAIVAEPAADLQEGGLSDPDALIPLEDLQGLLDLPDPPTAAAVLRQARELCRAERPADQDAALEIDNAQLVAYEALAKHGHSLSAADRACADRAEAALAEE